MWIKKLRNRKLQSILIVLIVMVCAMLMTSSLVIMTSLGSPYRELTEESKSPALKLYLFEESYENASKVKEKFEKLEEVEQVSMIEYNYLQDNLKFNDKKIEDFLNLVVYDERLHDNVRILEGDMNNLKKNECFIPGVLAYKDNIETGDVLEISEGVSYIVKGIYTEPYNMSISYDIEIIINEMPQDLDSNYYLSIFTDTDLEGTELIDIYRESNNKILEGWGITLEGRISDNQMTEQILGGILLAMSIMILLVSGIMIQYMIKNTLITDKKSVAIYKTLGYKNNLIIGIYMKFYSFLVLIGSVLGAISSKFISDSFTKVTFQNLGVNSSNGIFTAGVFCVGVIISFVLLQVYFVLKKLKNIKPIEVFQGVNNVRIKRKSSGTSITHFSPLAMAVRNIKRDKKNTIIIIITCIVSAFCVNFAATAITLIKGMPGNNYYWLGFDKYDISMESIHIDEFENAVKEVEDFEEVEKVVKSCSNYPVSIEWKKGIGDTIISSNIYETYEDLEMPVLKGRNPKYSNEIAIGNFVAKKLGKGVGDYIDIFFSDNQKVTLLISGTFQSFFNMGKRCRLLGSTLVENKIDLNYTEGSIYIKEGFQANDFINSHSNEFKDMAKFTPRLNKYENIMNAICGPQLAAIGPFMVMALILGGLNIVAIVYLKNKNNSKINSIYKAIGYSAGHLLKTNIYYIFLIASVSILITVPLFVIIFPRFMILSMSFFGFEEYLVTYDPVSLLLCNLLALFAFIISGLLSSKSLFDNPIAELTVE
ncbi:FtsX-like permease family protein [Anaerocolumna sp.]|uniref:FtsX-like permease family protein n=1 Tax=Anaerocolumna sp. TaxID=2041569 RepID=UPI0028A7110B|nr:FtsX-like permease family protein [Anaerocolumna sp.]